MGSKTTRTVAAAAGLVSTVARAGEAKRPNPAVPQPSSEDPKRAGYHDSLAKAAPGGGSVRARTAAQTRTETASIPQPLWHKVRHLNPTALRPTSYPEKDAWSSVQAALGKVPSSQASEVSSLLSQLNYGTREHTLGLGDLGALILKFPAEQRAGVVRAAVSLDRGHAYNHSKDLLGLMAKNTDVDWPGVVNDFRASCPTCAGFRAYMALRRVDDLDKLSPSDRQALFSQAEAATRIVKSKAGKDYADKYATHNEAILYLQQFRPEDRPDAVALLEKESHLMDFTQRMDVPKNQALEAAEVLAYLHMHHYEPFAEAVLKLSDPGARLAFARSMRGFAPLLWSPTTVMSSVMGRLGEASPRTRAHAGAIAEDLFGPGSKVDEFAAALFLRDEKFWDADCERLKGGGLLGYQGVWRPTEERAKAWIANAGRGGRPDASGHAKRIMEELVDEPGVHPSQIYAIFALPQERWDAACRSVKLGEEPPMFVIAD